MKKYVFSEFFNRLNRVYLTEDECKMNKNQDQIIYWKNNVYSAISTVMIFLGGPLFFYGAFMFFSQNKYIHGIFEIIIFLLLLFFMTRKKLSIDIRKIIVVYTFYGVSILLLLFTGPFGAGVTCIVLAMVFVGTVFKEKQTIVFFIINLVIFAVLTIFLQINALEGFEISKYGSAWYINMATTQFCGFMSLILIHLMYKGMFEQYQRLEESKKKLADSEITYRAMIANIDDVIAILDKDGKFRYCSPNIIKINGISAEDAVSLSVFDFIYQEEKGNVRQRLEDLLSGRIDVLHEEVKAHGTNGEVKYIEYMAVNQINNEYISGILVNFHDITERKIKEERIKFLYERDKLTKLFNRTFIENRFAELNNKENLPIAIIYADLNGLKMINDALGYEEGDSFLKKAARIFKESCPKDAIIARAGGDEFIIILTKTDEKKAEEIIYTINESCNEVNKGIKDDILYFSVSLGFAIHEQNGEPLELTLKIAENAMYKKKVLEEKSIHNSILISMQRVLYEKSQETEAHAIRLVEMSKKIGMVMKLSSTQIDELELAAKLHDIGKIGIDERILEKATKLTDEEWEVMKTHPEIGYRIAKSSGELASIADYIYAHHERWDGEGYPRGLKGEDIPLIARIINLVDSYDAMTEDRIYRKGISHEEAIEEINRNSGMQFDPEIVQIFLKIISKENK